jgi:hypothetical protein
MAYRTQDGLADYGFSIEFESDEGWRIYIIFQPFCHAHDDSLQLPYQSIDSKGRRYVDWSENLDSLGDAKQLPRSGPSWLIGTSAAKNNMPVMSS